MLNKTLWVVGFLALTLGAGNLKADQIDNEVNEATARPNAVMVKIDPTNKTVELFSVDSMDVKAFASELNNLSPEAKEAEIAKLSRVSEVTSHKIGEFAAVSNELDNEGSTPAWHGRWWGGWRWNNWGGWGGSCWNRPWYNTGYVSWGYSPYRYNYGWSYGYNNCNYGWYW